MRSEVLTVGEVIDQLEKYPRDSKFRVLIHHGLLQGVDRVVDIQGRVTLIPTFERSREHKRFKRVRDSA